MERAGDYKNPFTMNPTDSIDDPRGRLLDGNQAIGSSASATTMEDRLAQTQRLALETEQLGISVLADLRRQREQIERAGQVLHETDTDISRSNKILRDIRRR